MMPTWKKNIFVSAIKAKMILESKTAYDIITEYTALSDVEKTEILMAI